jgi:hypothetical protein
MIACFALRAAFPGGRGEQKKAARQPEGFGAALDNRQSAGV